MPVLAGKTVLCRVTLSAGKGSCVPANGDVLTAGSYEIIASYGASTDFATSKSTAASLVVT